MHRWQRIPRAVPAGVLSVLMMLGMAWAALSGVHLVAAADSTQPPGASMVAAAVVPQSVTTNPPEVRRATEPHPGMLLLFVATVAALLFGLVPWVRWPVVAGLGSAATPAVVLRGLRGRAPPRRLA